MVFTWEELINRARVYLDDNHDEEGGFIEPADWLTIAQVEYAQLYRRWVNTSLISPEYVDTAFTGATATPDGVLAIVGVAEVVGDSWRVLPAGQPNYGRAPFRSSTAGPAMEWEARGMGDDLTVYLQPPDTSSSYVVRFIPAPAYETDIEEEVDLPYGADERLVLGIARRAHLKDSMVSSLLNGLIIDADAQLALTAFGRGAGPKITHVRSTPRNEMPRDPRMWKWF